MTKSASISGLRFAGEVMGALKWVGAVVGVAVNAPRRGGVYDTLTSGSIRAAVDDG